MNPSISFRLQILLLVVLPFFLALGLKEIADWKSVLLMSAMEYVFYGMWLAAIGRIFAKKNIWKAILRTLLLAELPTVIFPILVLCAFPTHIINGAGAFTIFAGATFAYYSFDMEIPQERQWTKRLSGFFSALGYIFISLVLSQHIISPSKSFNEAPLVVYKKVIPYDENLNSIQLKQILPSNLIEIPSESSEFQILQMLLKDALEAYYNNDKSKILYYGIHEKLWEHRQSDEQLSEYGKSHLRSEFFINKIYAAEISGAVEFFINGKIRFIPSGDSSEKITEKIYNIYLNVFRNVSQNDFKNRPKWLIYYMR